MNFREKLIRFMQGRYGIDQLSKFILVIGVVCVLISALFGDHPAGADPLFSGVDPGDLQLLQGVFPEM